MKIEDARSLPAIAQEDLRRRAVLAFKEGKIHTEVAEILGFSRQTVGELGNKYRPAEAKALNSKRKGRPIREEVNYVPGNKLR